MVKHGGPTIKWVEEKTEDRRRPAVVHGGFGVSL